MAAPITQHDAEALLRHLKQAISLLDADAGLEDPNLCVGEMQCLDLSTGRTVTFDAWEARMLIERLEMEGAAA